MVAPDDEENMSSVSKTGLQVAGGELVAQDGLSNVYTSSQSIRQFAIRQTRIK